VRQVMNYACRRLEKGKENKEHIRGNHSYSYYQRHKVYGRLKKETHLKNR